MIIGHGINVKKENKQMPYILKSDRARCDEVVKQMIASNIKVDGDLNYILFKFCKYFYSHSYNNLKNYCGELRQCATEIERKILAPYEEMKEKENGSV